MSTSKRELASWFKRGQEKGASHMIVVCDTFDYSDYPVFVKREENCRTRYEEFNGKNMQRVMEVYNLDMSMDEQLADRRVFNF